MKKILVVDDEALLVKGIRFNLQNEGYDVVTGSNGLEAVSLAQNGDVDLIVLDVMMPEPLPVDHPLWETKNTILTPHISGNMTLGYTCDLDVNMFCEDLINYAEGKPLQHVVDRKRGY